MAKRGLYGWLPDPKDERDVPFGVLATMDAPPAAATLRQYAGPLLVQQNQDCVAHAVVQAIHVCHAMLGSPRARYASRRWVYWNSRNYHNATALDEGTFLRTAMDGVAALGFCPEEDWPYEMPWSERPDEDAYVRAIDQKLSLARFRIDGTGATRVLNVRRAIASGYPVVAGFSIAEAFENARPGQIVQPPTLEDVVGGHALPILEYDEKGFYGPNSWGVDYGTDGWFAVSPSYVGWDYASDFWALQSAPLYDDGAPNDEPTAEVAR